MFVIDQQANTYKRKRKRTEVLCSREDTRKQGTTKPGCLGVNNVGERERGKASWSAQFPWHVSRTFSQIVIIISRRWVFFQGNRDKEHTHTFTLTHTFLHSATHTLYTHTHLYTFTLTLLQRYTHLYTYTLLYLLLHTLIYIILHNTHTLTHTHRHTHTLLLISIHQQVNSESQKLTFIKECIKEPYLTLKP